MSKIALFRTNTFLFIFSVALALGISISFAIDTDNDGMSDFYENFFKLSPTNSLDAAENYDSDLLNNMQESTIWTDPDRADTDADGVPDDADRNALSRAVIRWGNPVFTEGDEYLYTGPAWWLGAGKSGGEWGTNGNWQVTSSRSGSLYIDFDRSILTRNLMLEFRYLNSSNSVACFDLLDTNNLPVATNLHGNILSGSGDSVNNRFIIPLTNFPAASRLLLSVDAGDSTFEAYLSVLFIDDDTDGLDADQEIQFGTLDTDPDCDTDNLTDYAEIMVAGTDPLDPDSDHDGFYDGLELNELRTSPTVPMWQEGGVAGVLQVERWNVIEGFTAAALKANEHFGNVPDTIAMVTSAEYAPPGLDAGDNYGIRMRGTITAPTDGTYTFQLTGDCQAEVWLSDNSSPYGRRKLLYLGQWTNVRDLANPVVPFAKVELASGQTCYVEILLKEDIYFEHVSLWWTRPGETEPEVIGSQYLRSYVQPGDDGDMDGLPDAADPNPFDGTGGGYKDTDGDGFTDHEEINFMGASPIISMWKDGVAGVLQVERWDGIEGFSSAALKADVRFGGTSDISSLVTSAEYAPPELDAGDNYGIRMRGTVTAPVNGTYTFLLTGDCDAEVWLSNSESPYDRRFLFELGGWIGYQDLENPLVQSATVELVANQPYYFEILLKEDMYLEHVSLWWTRPGETVPEVIGSKYLHSYVQPADDGDADGLPDAKELAYGLDPLNGTGGGYKDSDGDGFSDHEELNLMGTSPVVSMWQDGIPGVLQVERWNDIKGASTADLKTNERFGGVAEAASLVTSTEYAPDGLDAGDNYGIRMRGTISAPADGPYIFTLTGDCAAEVWLSGTASPYGRRLLLGLENWTNFQQLEHPHVPSATVQLAAGQTYYVEILLKEDMYFEHVSLWWTRPGETEPEIIGSNYLHSYVQPPDDGDADGLPDAWELAYGLDPANGTGGGYQDSDGDGYCDLVEFTFGLDPQGVDADADGLSDCDEVFITFTDPDRADSDADGVPDLRTAVSIPGTDFVDCFNPHITATWSTTGTTAVVSKPYANPWIVYNLAVTNAGMYRIAVDATTLSAYAVQLVVEIDGIQIGEILRNHSPDLPAYTFFTPWISEGDHTLKLLVRGYFSEASPFQIHSVKLGAVDGADSNGDGIQDWMKDVLDKGLDTDGDGITDLDEIRRHGTSPTDADTDGDGLSDGAELAVGTDLLDADSDDDGVVDGVEVNESLTNPLVAEFDGSVTVVETVSGAATNAVVGDWEIQGSELLSKGVRGSVEYIMTFPSNDLLRLNINATHQWSKSSCSPVLPKVTSAFLVYIDQVYVGKFPLVSADGVYVDVNAFLPVMPAGEHTVKLYWENVYSRLAVKIQSLELQSLGGPDANGNGTKDWIEASVNAMAGVDGIVPQASRLPRIESFVSPACIEGNARYVEFMEITGGSLASATKDGEASIPPQKGAGPRWYTNLPLKPNRITKATATFQNGALEVPIKIRWKPYNLLDHNGATLTIRKGDALRLTCIDSARAKADLKKAKGGKFELNLSGWNAGETPAVRIAGVPPATAATSLVSSPNTRPLVVAFDEAGTYVVNGDYRKGKKHSYATCTIQVVDGSFPEESPACLVGRERQWTFEGMPANIVYEVDDTVECTYVEATSSSLATDPESDGLNVPEGSSLASTTLSLKANDTNGDHIMLARLYPGGPILAATRLDTFWIQNATDGYFWTVETYEDSELWEVRSVAKNVPDSVDIQIKVIVGGVMFDDYTLERWLTNTAYNDIGEYNFRLFHPNDAPGSTCHTFKLYQNGQFIGEAFGGGQNDIGEE